jgi:hypothetical protein
VDGVVCPRNSGPGHVPSSPVVSLPSTTATRTRLPRPTSLGWLGQYAPETRAPGVSQALLWCRYAPPQPPTPTQAREHNGVAGAVCPRDKSLGRLSCGVAALHHSHPSSGAGKLQFRSAAPREVFGHHVRRLVKRSGPSYPLPDHLRRREGSRPVGLRKAGLPGRQAEVSGLVLPRAAAGRPRSSSAVRRSPAAAGCRPPVAQRRPGFPPASLRRPHTGASSPSEPSLADPRAARRNRPAEGWGVGS